MSRPSTPLPNALGSDFSVHAATKRGVKRGRLRGGDLASPFPGIRMLVPDLEDEDSAARNEQTVRRLARAYSHRLRDADTYCCQTSAVLQSAPLPWTASTELHVATVRPTRTPRVRGVIGHSVSASHIVTEQDGTLRYTDAATTWAMLAECLDVPWLVVVGDYFCRVWLVGHGRTNVGAVPLATPEQLSEAMGRCRRRGIAKLREALSLVRLDSWSPRESLTRYYLVTNGLPEPVLNRDFFDEFELFLACLDMAYPEYKVAVEYQGRVHGAQYSKDIERLDRLRAEGWIVVQVSSELLNKPEELVRRVREALCSRGWSDVSDSSA